MKAQSVRLIDVFVLGPLMVYVASFRGAPQWARTGLALTGVATIIYNARSYLALRE